jgi:hypothetical protein
LNKFVVDPDRSGDEVVTLVGTPKNNALGCGIVHQVRHRAPGSASCTRRGTITALWPCWSG